MRKLCVEKLPGIPAEAIINFDKTTELKQHERGVAHFDVETKALASQRKIIQQGMNCTEAYLPEPVIMNSEPFARGDSLRTKCTHIWCEKAA